MSSRLLLAFGLAAGLGLMAPTGCSRTGGQVQSGIDMYERGAYEGAILRFQEVGADETELRSKHRVRYLAYRGLAHWHLRQLDEARSYLTGAQAALAEEGANPKWLPVDIREELDRAFADLGLGLLLRSRGVPLPPPSAPAEATQPPPPPTTPAAPPPPGAAPPPPGPPGASPPAPAPTVSPAPGPAPPGAPPMPGPPMPGPPQPGPPQPVPPQPGPPGAPIPPAASPPPADPL